MDKEDSTKKFQIHVDPNNHFNTRLNKLWRKTPLMLSKNEWDPLKSVIVGIADDARIPLIDPSLRVVNYADQKHSYNINTGRYPQQVIDEANEDLNL